jgi:hypothetical protein
VRDHLQFHAGDLSAIRGWNTKKESLRKMRDGCVCVYKAYTHLLYESSAHYTRGTLRQSTS